MKKYLFLLLVTCTVIFPALALASEQGLPELPKPTGAIRGTVSDTTGKAVSGAKVEVFSCSDETVAATTVTGKEGGYLVGALPAGCYHTRYSGAGYQSSWYGTPDRRDTATDIKVGSEPVTGIDASLTEGRARISGVIKSSEGTPLQSAWVMAVMAPAKEAAAKDVTYISDGITDANGAYTVNVHPGKHVLVFGKKGYVSKINGKNLLNPSMVESSETKPAVGVDAVLARGGSIAGSVKNEAGKELAGIYVAAMALTGNGFPASTRTDEDGNFSLEGLSSGKYNVIFADKDNNYLLQWYDGKNSPENATPVSVNAPATTSGIRVVLRQGAGLAGKVTDPAGNPVAEVTVFAQGTEKGSRFGHGSTDANGDYQVMGLPPGKYLVSFRPADASGLLPRFYRDAASKEGAAPVEVGTGQVTFNIDQVLPQGKIISGSVKDALDAPVSGAYIVAYPAAKGSKATPSYTGTGENGTYSVTVPEGEYVLEVRAEGFMTQWSGKRASREEAAVIATAKDQAASQADFVLLRGGSISGTVRNRAGAGLAQVRVTASDAATGEEGSAASTDENGKYTIQALKAGSYRLAADGSAAGYIEAKLPQAVTVGEAGSQQENVNFVLVAGGSISGKVSGADGNPLAWITVDAYDPTTWDELGSTSTEGDGQFKIGGLPEGKYCIRYDRSAKYPVQWYKGKFRREDSTQVEVRGTGTVTGVDATLTTGFALSGTVTDVTGAPLADSTVEVYGGSEDEPITRAHADPAGKYSVPALAPGSYRLRFSVDGYVPRWVGGSDRRSATLLTVQDADLTGVNISLNKAAGKFAGKLMNPEGHKVGQAWLTVLDAATGQAVADERICECNGLFDTGVPTGWYRLRVERHGQVFWYRGTSQEDAASLPGSGELAGLDMVIDDSGVKNKQAQDATR